MKLLQFLKIIYPTNALLCWRHQIMQLFISAKVQTTLGLSTNITLQQSLRMLIRPLHDFVPLITIVKPFLSVFSSHSPNTAQSRNPAHWPLRTVAYTQSSCDGLLAGPPHTFTSPYSISIAAGFSFRLIWPCKTLTSA